jgi:hypothetical protein
VFFWIALVVMIVVVASLIVWASRGVSGRAHEPGTQRLIKRRD